MRLKSFLIINVVAVLMMCFAATVSATQLTFDITKVSDNTQIPDYSYIGTGPYAPFSFDTVYGDKAATGGTQYGTAYNYSYNGTTADTPKISVGYAVMDSFGHTESNPSFTTNIQTRLGATLFSGAAYYYGVIRFDPNANYQVSINSFDINVHDAGARLKIQIWEGIGTNLDTVVANKNYVKDIDYALVSAIADDTDGRAVGTYTFTPNITSDKTLWLVFGTTNGFGNWISVDNVVFNQSLSADFSGDGKVNFKDYSKLAQNWLLDYDPFAKMSFGNNKELIIGKSALLPFGIYGLYPGMVGQDVNNPVVENWANVTYILDPCSTGGNRIKQLLDEAKAQQERILIYPYPREVYDRIVGGLVGTTLANVDRDMITNWVNRFKGHAGLLGWYLIEEPEGTSNYVSPSWCQAAYNHIKSIDKYNHPVVIVNNTAAGVTNYKDAADVMMPDPYPRPLISNGNAASGGSIINYIKPLIDAAVAAGKPVWYVPQLFNYAMFSADSSNTRAPTFDELRGLIYGAIVRGAKGSIGYAWGNALTEPDVDLGYKYIGTELNRIEPVIVSGSAASASSNNADVYVLSRSYNGELVTIAVNFANAARNGVTITQSQSGGTLYVMSEGRTVSPSSGQITGENFAPYGVHIYTSKEYLTKSLAAIKTDISTRKTLVYNSNTDPTYTNLAYHGTVNSGHYAYRMAINDGYCRDREGGLYPEGANYYNFEPSGDFIEVTLPSATSLSYAWLYSNNPYYTTERFENLTIKVYTGGSWKTVKTITGNTATCLTAQPEDFALIGNPSDITKVRFEGTPAGTRAVNEVVIFKNP